MSSGNNNPPRYNTNFVAAAAAAAAASTVPPPGGGYYPPPTNYAMPSGLPGSPPSYPPKADPKASKNKGVAPAAMPKPKAVVSSSNTSGIKGSTAGNSSSNKGNSSKMSGSVKSGGSSGATSRQVPGNTGLEFNTPKQNQMLSQCDYVDRTIWATRVLWGGNAVNGFLRATATAQRIKKQRARQNNSTKQNRAAKAAGVSGDDKSAAAAKANSSILANNSSNNNKAKEIFNQHEEELLKKEIMNPRTAKKLKGELEAGLTFCATVCNVLRGVLFDIDPSLSPSLPQHLNLEHEKPPPAHTFLIPSPPPAGVQYQRPSSGSFSSGSSKLAKGTTKSKASATTGSKTGSASNKTSGSSKQQQQQQQQQPQPLQPTTAESSTSSPGDPGNSTLRRLRKTTKKNKAQSIASEPGFVNLPPEFDPFNSNKRSCTKKEYQHRVFQLLRYRDLKQGDFCAARLSSRDLWILAKVLKDYKTTSLAPVYAVSPVEFLTLSDARRDALFQKEKVVLEDVEDQQATAATQVVRSLVLPLPRSPAEANDWTNRIIKKGSRVYAMYPQTTSLYAATVTDSTTYCRGDDDIIVVQFDGEEADPTTGQLPTYHIPARFVTLIPREFPASQSGRATVSTTKSTASAPAASGTKRKSSSSSAASSSNNKRRSAGGDDEFLGALSMDFAGGGFDDLDLDFDKPLDDHEQEAAQGDFSPF